MNKTFSFLICLQLLMLSACAPQQVAVDKRYFWPLPVQGVEPKLEYLGFYQTDHDLRRSSTSWVEDYVLGKYPSQALFVSPFGVSSDSSGRVFVTDTAAHTAIVLDSNNGEVRVLKDGDGKPHFLVMPTGICVSNAGLVYVADSLKSRVYKYSAEERLVATFGDALALTRPVAVAVDKQERLIYILDVGAHNIVVSDDQGNLMYKFGERGHGEGQFNYPTDIDLDQEGNIYVLDTMNFRVQVFSPTGDFLREFGEQGTELGSFRIPKGLAVSPNGDVYVTDSLSHRFVVFDKEGKYLMTLGDQVYHLTEGKMSPGGFYMPRDIDVDADGGIWVVDAMNKMVHNFQFLTESYLEKFPIITEQVFFPPGGATQ